MALYLIRHGETAANAARVVQLPSVPLSERGLGQAERLATRLAGEGIARILSSDLRRAAMTAQAVQAATGAELGHDPLLQERNFGALRGTAYDDIGFDPFAAEYEPPGGESVPAFHGRVARAWATVEALAQETDGHLAVVTHGLVCAALVTRHLTLAPGVEQPRRWRNTSVTIAEREGAWQVCLLDCVAHLDAADSREGGGA